MENLSDYLLSRFKFYRKRVGGIWRLIYVMDEVIIGTPRRVKWKGWVREDFETKKTYWTKNVEAYGQKNHKKAVNNFKAFHHLLEV